MKCDVDIAGNVLQIDTVERFLCREEDFNSVQVDRYGFLSLFSEDDDKALKISKVLTKKRGAEGQTPLVE
jgi:hypothetical protein